MRATAEPTYATQMGRPFLAVLARHPKVPAELVEQIMAWPDDQRLAVSAGQRFLEQMVKLTGEQDLGLLAAMETRLGTFDVLEFVGHSAPTWRAAVETVFRYVTLMNGAARFRLQEVEGKAQVVLESAVPLTRAGIDFQSAAFYLASARMSERPPVDLEVWFTYAQPSNLARHRAVFGNATLRFSAPWNGFVHDAALLDRPVASANPKLHSVLREHSERLLEKLAPGDGLIEHVRAQLLETLSDGRVSAESIAARLGLSRRTLTRRLAQHDTSFTELREDVLRNASAHYLTASDQSIDDIAFLLGYSESSAFVRAFKRWYGVGPAAYRRRERAD